MGFNKRYLNQEKLMELLNLEGIDYLIDFIKKPDILIIEDQFSENICNLIKENDEKKF